MYLKLNSVFFPGGLRGNMESNPREADHVLPHHPAMINHFDMSAIKPNRSPSYIHQLRVHELQHDLALSVFFFSSGVTPPQNWYNNPNNPAIFLDIF